jgi:hypothetical protein
MNKMFVTGIGDQAVLDEIRKAGPVSPGGVQYVEGPQLSNPLDVQVAGGHYKSKKIQPVEYIHANKLNFLEGCIVKRITRWRDKPAESRFQDLEKIKHEVDLLIEMEQRHG